MKKKTVSIILWVLVVCWMGFIFSMSVQPGNRSHEMSSDVLEKIHDISQDEVKRTDEVHTKNFIDYYQYTIRQTAHFAIFTVLGILTTVASLHSFQKTAAKIMFPLFISVLYSLIDELVQICVPGRAFEWNDLGTDIVGALLGCIVVYMVFRIIYVLKKKMRRIIICIILWSLVVGWMAFIFSMSAEPAIESTETSGNTLRAIFKVIYPGFKDLSQARQQEIIDQNQHFIRKAAHFSAYTLMGILISLAVAQHISKFSLVSYAIGTLYAASDEIHQRFVPGRSGQISDVLLDSAGVALGCVMIFILYKLIIKKRAKL